MGEFRCSAREGNARVQFYGPDGGFQARVFRGRIGREMALGLGALEIPTRAREIRNGWRVTVPPWWHQRHNEVERRLMVFRNPVHSSDVGETVLEFETPIPPSLEQAITAIFHKEATNGSEGQQQQRQERSPEADGGDVPLPEGHVAAGAGDGPQPGLDAGQQDQPEGQPLTEATPSPAPPASAGGAADGVPSKINESWVQKVLEKGRRRTRGRRGRR